MICDFQIRVTGILVQDNQLLLVRQKVNPKRQWSLPGGRVDKGEKLDEAMTREILEETGINVKVNRLLFVCDKLDSQPQILHITFLLERVGNDEIILPTNEYDKNPISDVKYVVFTELPSYGFSKKFIDILINGFPNTGYMGLKENIGL